ncbi:MAG: DUF2868 domain-containing protein [Chthoniobacteraceae bacterium]
MTSIPTNDWRIDDVIDFEFFLAGDKSRTDEEIALRDRAIYSDKVHRCPEQPDQRKKIRLWLETRREETRRTGEELPGQLFHEAHHFLLTFLCAAGLLFGAAVAASHLYYYGDLPINVLVFLSVTVLPQLLLLAIVAASLFFKNAARPSESIGLIRWIFRRILLRLIEGREKALDHMDGRTRLRFGALWGMIQSRRATYGTLWIWPVLVLTQAFAVCFNIGVIAMILLLVTVSNRAFGWETTLHVGPEAMFHFIKAVALPWSWLPCAHPTLEQIIGSRVSLHGGTDYPVEALVSWWPFLCYTVFFYGLLPRTILLVVAGMKQKSTLAGLPFNHSECNRLIRLMEPLVIAGPSGPKLTIVNPGEAASPHPDANSCIVITPTEFTLSETTLGQCLQRLGWKPRSFTSAEIDLPDANATLFEMLGNTDWQGSRMQLVVALNASRPPIKAILLFLKKLRNICGDTTAITLFLVTTGDAKGEYPAIWKQTVAAMGDPHLSVECEACHE